MLSASYLGFGLLNRATFALLVASWGLIGVAVMLFLLLVAGLYLSYVIMVAKDKVSSAPREDMYMCDKHGPIAKKHILKLEGYTEVPIEYCPICWQEKYNAAKQK